MSKKNTKRPRRHWRVAGRRGYVLVGSVGLIAVLGLATAAGPWRTSFSRTRVGSLFFSPPPPLPTINSTGR